MSSSRQLTKLSAISADIETVASTTTAALAGLAPALPASSQPQITSECKRSLGSSESAEQVVTSLQVNSKTKVSPSKRSSNSPDQLGPASATTAAPAPAAAAAAAASITGPIAIISSNDSKLLKKSKHSKHVLDPSGSLYYHWSMVVSFAFLYNFWSLSYRFAFREIDADTVALWFALDYSADIIYILDIVINSRTGYLEDGVLQRNVDLTGQHYRESTIFYLDCLCLLPLDILYLSFGYNSILRCTRLVKIYKFWSYVDRTERHTNYPNVFRTFALVHYILVIFHWNACLFHMISKNNIIDIENLYKINDNQCFDILCQYLHAFYWSTLALTTIGDLPRPRTKGEYIYVTVELIFGLFLFASVLGHVANIVTNVSAARKEFQAKLDAVKTFMRMRRVSDELQNKVIRWFDYLWISQQSSDEDKSVACLPDRLKAEIAIHVHLDTLKRVDIFQNTEAGFLCELVLRLKPVLFSPGDYVCRKNEVGHEMYIVSRGILEVVTDEGKTVVATLKAGSYFGEISVLNVGLAGNKRTASVRSVGYSDLFCLNKQDLWDVLKNYPNAEARIRARAEERLSKLDINASQPQQQQPQQQQQQLLLQQKRRQLGSGNASSRLAQTEGQRSLQEKSRMASRSRRLQASSCACFTSDAKCSHVGGGPQLRGFGPDSSSNNNNNKSECGCCRLAAEPNEGSSPAASKRPAAAAASRQCHKSRASLNSGVPAVAAQCRLAPWPPPPAPPPSSQRHGGGGGLPPSDCYFRNASNDTDDHELARIARRLNQRQTLAANGDLEASGERRELLAYSRSFDQSPAPADHAVKQCQDSSLDSEEDQDEGGGGGATFSCSSSAAHGQTDHQWPAAADRSRRRRLAVRRSSSAEPPIDADSWRQLQALRRANGAEPPTCRSSLVDRRRRHGRPRRRDGAGQSGVDAARAAGLSRQPACHTNSLEEPECTGCKWKRRQQRRQQQQQHVNSTASRLDHDDGDCDADDHDHDVPRQFQAQPPPLPPPPLPQLQQQPPTPLSGYWIPVNAGPAGGFIQVPMQLTPAPTLTPESQLSLAGSSAATANNNALGGGQSVMTQARAQSVSTMFLNFGGQQHQAALVSPAISSQASFFGLASQQQQQQPITPRQSEIRRQEGRDSTAAAAAAAAVATTELEPTQQQQQQRQPDRDELKPTGEAPRQGAAGAEMDAPPEEPPERRRRPQKVDDAAAPDEAQTCPDFK